MGDTKIEWSDKTWNPVVGCAAVSPGCDHCYAAREASGRLKNIPVYSGLAEGGVFTGEVRELRERLDQPLRWRKPARIFVNSMSDLFNPEVSDLFIAEVFAVMGLASHHQFQILTKRPKVMASMLTDPDGELRYKISLARKRIDYDADVPPWPLPNVWLGTSIESDRYTFRANHLRATPAAVRFLSCEPLLGPLPSLDYSGIDWVIVGGESGPKARPMNPDWVRLIREECVYGWEIPFLFKQWGEWAPPYDLDHELANAAGGTSPPPRHTHAFEDGSVVMRVGKKVAGRSIDGRTWDQYPKERKT